MDEIEASRQIARTHYLELLEYLTEDGQGELLLHSPSQHPLIFVQHPCRAQMQEKSSHG